ncbi:MAG: TetR/AcrR family transcriptional regulator [Rhizobiales bacterium]|nr:TetR/AcrR family transcriptional regulator [Hyphomicrobiales bacterium]
MALKPSTVGRPREFNQDIALSNVVDVFWRKGFSATNYADLEQATGLHRQSLVYAFGDKRSLLQAALNHYAGKRVSAVVEELDRTDIAPIDAVTNVFAMWLEDARRAASPGCLLVNTAGEVGRRDAELTKILEGATERLVTAFEKAFARAKAAGQMAAVIDAKAMARMAVALGDGALLRSRSSGDPEFAGQAFSAFLKLLKN